MATIVGTDCVAYWDAEGTEGTVDSSATFAPISQHTDFEITYTNSPVVVTTSGGRDPTASATGAQLAQVKLKGSVGPDAKTFLITYGTNATTAVTILITNGTQYYTIKGCRVKDYSLKCTAAAEGPGPLDYEINLEGWTVTMTSPTTPTLSSVTAGFTSWADITMTVGGSSITWRSFDLKVQNTLDKDYSSAGAVTAIRVGTRSHDGKIVYTSPTSVTDFTTVGATTTKTIVVSATGLVVTATNAVFTEVSEKIPNDKIVTREISWMNGGTFTIAAS